jgi:hypothetical protein
MSSNFEAEKYDISEMIVFNCFTPYSITDCKWRFEETFCLHFSVTEFDACIFWSGGSNFKVNSYIKACKTAVDYPLSNTRLENRKTFMSRLRNNFSTFLQSWDMKYEKKFIFSSRS